MKTILLNISLVFLLIITFAAQGCKEQDPILVPGLGSLYDPAVRPAVIFTYPADNSFGPYTGLYAGEGMYTFPHFRIQFNKMMKDDAFSGDKITISGFDEPVTVASYSYSSQTGIYDFMVRQKNGDSYYNLPTYRLGRTYTVTVSSTVQDIHNQNLAKDYHFSFTLGNSFKVTSALPKDSLASSYREVRMNFNSPVDTNIISKLSIAPAISGNWSIENSGMTVTFYANTTYTENTVYTVTLAANASDKYGNTLGTPYIYSFKSGMFSLTSSYPNDGQTGVTLDNSLYLYFSASVLNSSVLGGFTITPTVNGYYNNYGSTINFVPLEPLKEKTTYTIALNKSIKSVSGSALTKAYTITFTTEGFRVKQFLPYNYEKISRYSNIEFSFNTQCDTSTVAAGFTISPAVAGKIYFSNKNKMVTFKPDAPMLPNATYIISMNNALKSAAGNSLDNLSSYSFTTGE